MDSDFHIAFAEAEEERRAVYRFRYEIYVEEMGKYRSVADHAQRLFHEPVDEQSRIIYATQNGEVVATGRSTWGGDGPFPQRMIDQYGLAPFLAEVPAAAISVGERGNSKTNVNSPEAGYLIPIVFVPEDVAYLRRINSPLLEYVRDFGDDARIPACTGHAILDGAHIIASLFPCQEECRYARQRARDAPERFRGSPRHREGQPTLVSSPAMSSTTPTWSAARASKVHLDEPQAGARRQDKIHRDGQSLYASLPGRPPGLALLDERPGPLAVVVALLVHL